MDTNFLIRAWVGRDLVCERWDTFDGAKTAQAKYEAAGNIARVDWLSPDLRLLDVSTATANPEDNI